MSDQALNHPALMIVEDEEGLRESMVEILKLEGYTAHSASNGKEALELLKVIQKPCLILLDMMMPVMNGRAFLDEITVDMKLNDIPVLIVSAFENPNTKGAIGVLNKPIDIDLLLTIVRKYCQTNS